MITITVIMSLGGGVSLCGRSWAGTCFERGEADHPEEKGARGQWTAVCVCEWYWGTLLFFFIASELG